MKKINKARRKACDAFYWAATLYIHGTPSERGYEYIVKDDTAYRLCDRYAVYDERVNSFIRPDDSDEYLNVIEALAYILCYAYDDSKYIDVVDAVDYINSLGWDWLTRVVLAKTPRRNYNSVRLPSTAIEQARLIYDLWAK